MYKQLRPALLMLAILTFITGAVYPLIVTVVTQLEFPAQAHGSLLGDPGQPVGSRLLGQANDDPRYFWPRPSATGYNAMPSGASNLGPTNANLAGLVAERAIDFRAAHGLGAETLVPVEMLFASGSGLDPHISPDAARLQVGRIAEARGLYEDRLIALVNAHIEGPQLGFLGDPRVNVLVLNLALDDLE